ncbi:hypothetical protein LSAT2_009696, partial [Lamellibrachia satsuma]
SIDQCATRLWTFEKDCEVTYTDGEIRAQILQKTSSRIRRREILKYR